jgi:hypothetical protein
VGYKPPPETLEQVHAYPPNKDNNNNQEETIEPNHITPFLMHKVANAAGTRPEKME